MMILVWESCVQHVITVVGIGTNYVLLTLLELEHQGGDVDTEIAKSIIDEADLICYIVTSDAIQETEF